MHALKIALAIVMTVSGLGHLGAAKMYEAMMPPWVPAHRALVLISGVFEIVLGLGLLFDQTQRAAAWGLIALFIAVFPANVHMAINTLPLNGKPVPTWVLWFRLPFQLVFIGWAYLFA